MKRIELTESHFQTVKNCNDPVFMDPFKYMSKLCKGKKVQSAYVSIDTHGVNITVNYIE